MLGVEGTDVDHCSSDATVYCVNWTQEDASLNRQAKLVIASTQKVKSIIRRSPQSQNDPSLPLCEVSTTLSVICEFPQEIELS